MFVPKQSQVSLLTVLLNSPLILPWLESTKPEGHFQRAAQVFDVVRSRLATSWYRPDTGESRSHHSADHTSPPLPTNR